jgi:hypothetical protein
MEYDYDLKGPFLEKRKEGWIAFGDNMSVETFCRGDVLYVRRLYVRFY